MSTRNTPLSPPPLAREIVGRVINTLKRIGTDPQKREAKEIEDVLMQHFYGQPEAVSFARAEEPAAPEGKKK